MNLLMIDIIARTVAINNLLGRPMNGVGKLAPHFAKYKGRNIVVIEEQLKGGAVKTVIPACSLKEMKERLNAFASGIGYKKEAVFRNLEKIIRG